MIREIPIRWRISALAAVLALALAPAAPARKRGKTHPEPGEGPRVSEERTGVLATREGLRLRLVTDLGNVRILTQDSLSVSYAVHLEADARDSNAPGALKQYSLVARSTPAGVQLSGQMPARDYRGWLRVNFEVRVPRNYTVDVLTQAGNIETQDIDGRVVLITRGGNITAGRLGGREAAGARLETAGGHITVQDVAGDLRALTAGGHITAANVQGDAVLHTGGGHIRAGNVRGTAEMETGGGNISVQGAGASVVASTSGGQIDVGEAGGSMRARTGGGGIRVLRVAGPLQLETSGGSICLTRVQSAVRASTAAGTITAWLTPEGKFAGASQLESGQGDIVVYLPRQIAITIEAVIEASADHRIEADPALPLKVSYFNSGAGRSLRGECALNGGGEVLRLKTVSGNIRLKFADTDPQLWQEREKENRHRLELHEQRLKEKLRQKEQLRAVVHEQMEKAVEQQQAIAEQQEALREAARPQAQAENPERASRLEELQRKVQEMWLGGVRVDPAMQQTRLAQLVHPLYPDVARQSGIEGVVNLKVTINKDGSVQNTRVLSGHPLLVGAAQDAVRKWRYRPTVVDGKPVNVITTVAVEFRLR